MATRSRETARSDYYDDPDFNYAHWWVGRDYEHRAEVLAIRRLLRGHRLTHAVDVGGGFGRLSVVLAEFADAVTLTDSSRQQLAIARSFLARHPSVTSRYMVASNLEFPDASVDLVAMVRVMHHLPEPATVLAEISRILRPGGYAIIEVANSAHAMNRVRRAVRGAQIPTDARPIGSHGQIAYVNHHPVTVARQFRDADLHIKRILSVSNLRHPVIKRVLPDKALLAVERIAQERVARTYFGPSMFFLLGKQQQMRQLCRGISRAQCGPHLRDEPLEHRVRGAPPDGVDRWLPHFPPVDKPTAQQGPDQLEVEAAMLLERAELLEVVELAVEHVCLSRVLGNEPGHRVPQRLGCFELGDQSACFDHRLFVPASEEVDCHLSLTADPGLTGLLACEDHRTDRAQQPERTYCGGYRGDLLSPVRHRATTRPRARRSWMSATRVCRRPT
jgi:SAM-dependent methyltransferase